MLTATALAGLLVAVPALASARAKHATKRAPTGRSRVIAMPDQRPFWVAGGFYVPVYFGSHYNYETFAQFGIEIFQFGYHFNKTAGGPAIVAMFDASFGYDFSAIRFLAGFEWDIPIPRIPLWIGPYMAPGVMWGSNNVGPYFDLRFGVQVKFVLLQRLLLYGQPLTFEVNVKNADRYGGTWQSIWGAGVIF
jgi:hypothetical protein